MRHVSRRRIWSAGAIGAFVLWAGFTAYKSHAVATELMAPPFYHPQPLDRVNATFAALATGDGVDPGGTWTGTEVEGLQLWTLRRDQPSKGIVLLLHGFGDDRWGTSPALKWFPHLDAAIFTYRRRDDAMRAGRSIPPVTFGAVESVEVVEMVHHLETLGWQRQQILLMGRSLGASMGLLAIGKLEAEGKGALGGLIWEGAPASSRSFGEALVRGPKDRLWHPLVAPLAGRLGAAWAARNAGYRESDTNVLEQFDGRTLKTPGLCFLATEDRLASPQAQRKMADHFSTIRLLEIPTWHLNCSTVLGASYAQAIQNFSDDVLDPANRTPSRSKR